MSNNKTIVYYSANIEDPKLEQKVIDGINKVKGDIPVISVTQKPLNFGHNICVGDVGYSYPNAFRQLLIGAEMATTDWIICCESDCLYPPTGYFDYEPDDPTLIHTYTNVWLLFLRRRDLNTFRRKEQIHGSIIYDRKFLIDFLKNHMLKGFPMWSNNRKERIPSYDPAVHKFKKFTGEPIVSLISGVNGRNGSTFTDSVKLAELPYWGSAKELKKVMLQ